MLTIEVEAYSSVIPELRPLLHEHYKELALNQDKVPLQPRWGVYEQAEAADDLLMVICRDNGTVIGYFVGFIAPGLHYETCLTCKMDIFYVAPSHRGGSLGIRLFKYVERELKARGVQRIFVGSKCHADASVLFERLKYSKVEVYYSKWIGD